MTITEYASVINELAKKHPTAQVVSSSDDEGNSFHPVHYHPAAGAFDGFQFDNSVSVKKVNAVCVN